MQVLFQIGFVVYNKAFLKVLIIAKAAMLWSKTPPIPYTEQEVTPSSHIPTSPKTTLPNRHGSLQSTDHIG